MSQTIVRQRSRKTPARKILVGPEDDGRRMSLSDFDKAEAKEGYLYELSRGIITVTDVPDWPHQMQIQAAYDQFCAHRLGRPKSIFLMSEGSGCQALVAD